jgi:hypothetical protein
MQAVEGAMGVCGYGCRCVGGEAVTPPPPPNTHTGFWDLGGWNKEVTCWEHKFLLKFEKPDTEEKGRTRS